MFVFSLFKKHIGVEIERFTGTYLFKIKPVDIRFSVKGVDLLPHLCSFKVPVDAEDRDVPNIFYKDIKGIKGKHKQLAYNIVNMTLNNKTMNIDNNDLYVENCGERTAKIIIRKKKLFESHQSVLKRVEDALSLEMF